MLPSHTVGVGVLCVSLCRHNSNNRMRRGNNDAIYLAVGHHSKKKKETKESNGEGKKATAQRSTGEGITRHVHTEGEGI
jgi:hypothetical protein